MARLVSALAVLALVAGLLSPLAVRPGSACSFERHEPSIEDSTIIVAGRFTDSRFAPKFDAPDVISEARAVAVELQAEAIFKGQVTGDIEVVYPAYRVTRVLPPLPRGAVADCRGLMGDNPSGQYAILGLTRGERGEWLPTSEFFLGPEPGGVLYDSAVHQLEPLGEPHMPASPASAQDDFPYLPAAAIALLIPTLFLAAAAFLPRRS